MPPKKTNYQNLLDFLVRSESTVAYRVVLLWAVLGMTPLAPMLPTIGDFKPLWTRITEMEQRQDEHEKKIAEVKVEVIETNRKLSGFEVDFNRYRALSK